MIPAFVIGLREGLEAALIVGIIAAFLVALGPPRRAPARCGSGVPPPSRICLAVGIGLQVADEALPQRQQEGLETIIALVAARRRHLDDRLVPAPRAAHEVDDRDRRRGRAGERVDHRPGRHGVLRRAPRGPGDGGLPGRGVPAVRPPGRPGRRRRARHRRGRRARLRDLPRRRAINLARFFRITGVGAGAGRRRPGVVGRAHGARGRLVRLAAGPGARPDRRDRARERPPGAGHRHVRHPDAADGRRGAGLAAVRGADDGLRAVAERRATLRTRGDRGHSGDAGARPARSPRAAGSGVGQRGGSGDGKVDRGLDHQPGLPAGDAQGGRPATSPSR